MTKSPGTLLTFYSYKGGTGRSMALANVAWILAASGRKVLVIDWDFEAPGLHRYFRPFLIDKELSSTRGLIDYFWSYAAQAMTPRDERESDNDQDWWKTLTDLDQFIVQLDWQFPEDGCLDFIPAGQQDSDYADRVTGFDWTKFYRRLNGAALLEALRDRLRSDYEFVLIDSRTGVSDSAGICTIAMPDRLVALFTLNRQSVDGVAAVLESILPQRTDRPLTIFPVITRVEMAEKERLDLARKRARATFAKFVGKDADPAQAAEYWSDMEVLYQPYYAYEEVLAPFADPSGEGRSTSSMLSAMERLTKRISGVENVTAPVVPDQQRRTVVDQFAGADPSAGKPAPSEDSEERRVRAQKYFERDLGNPTVELTRRAAHAKRMSLTTTMVVMASALFVPFAMALAPGSWPKIVSSYSLSIVMLSALTVLSSASEYLVRAQQSRWILRLATALSLLGSIGMNAWVASQASPTSPSGVLSPRSYPTLVATLCAIALFAHLVSAIRRHPEHGVRYSRACDSLLQEQRLYTNNAGHYATVPSPEAWRLFVDRVEMIMSEVSRPE